MPRLQPASKMTTAVFFKEKRVEDLKRASPFSLSTPDNQMIIHPGETFIY